MKRILIFSLAYYPRHVGGAEVALKEITDRLSPEEIEFHIVTLRFDSNLPKTEKIGNTVVHRIGFSRPSPSMSDLKKFLRRERMEQTELSMFSVLGTPFQITLPAWPNPRK